MVTCGSRSGRLNAPTMNAVFPEKEGPVYSCAALRRASIGLVLLLIAGASSLAYSAEKKKLEVTRTVTGKVLDDADNGISGAAVELTDLTANKKVSIYTAPDGVYKFGNLDPAHDYQVRAIFKGSSSETRKASRLDDRHQIVLNLRIPLKN